MARSLDITEPERRLLLRLTKEERNRLAAIIDSRYVDPDPVAADKELVEGLFDRLQ